MSTLTSDSSYKSQSFYKMDQVYQRVSRKFGVILCNEYDNVSDITLSDDDSSEKVDVLWKDGKFRSLGTCYKKSLTLLERKINKDYCVRKMVTNRRGRCVNVTQYADVQLNGTPFIIPNVSVHRLRSMTLLCYKDYVVLDKRFGIVQNILLKLTLKTQNGGRVEVIGTDFDGLNHIQIQIDYAFKTDRYFYPGQILKGSLKSLKAFVKWLTPKPSEPKIKSRKFKKFLVEKVETKSVFVRWFDSKEMTVTNITGNAINRLKKINKFNLNLYDACYLKIEEGDLDNLMRSDKWKKNRQAYFESNDNTLETSGPSGKIKELLAASITRNPKRKLSSGSYKERIKKNINVGGIATVTCIAVYTHPTVLWEDGTTERSVPSKDLLPYFPEVNSDCLSNFLPGNYVVLKNRCMKIGCQNYGVVRKVDSVGLTATVNWFDYEAFKETNSVQFIEKEDSFYHIEHCVCWKAVVIRRNDAKTIQGLVIDSTTNGLRILWSDGDSSTCWPHELTPLCIQYRAYRCDPLTESEYFDMVETEFINNFLKVCERLNDDDIVKDSHDIYKEIALPLVEMYDNCCKFDSYFNYTYFRNDIFENFIKKIRIKLDVLKNRNSLDAIQLTDWDHLITKMEISLTGSKDNLENIDNRSTIDEFNTLIEENFSAREFNSEHLLLLFCFHLCDILNKQFTQTFDEVIEYTGNGSTTNQVVNDANDDANDDINVVNVTDENMDKESFSNFLIVQNCPDNHVFKSTTFQPLNVKEFYRAVKFDQNLFKTSLPPGIIVKAYEDRTDLLSVMIKGPRHTPYEDGLFFFDIKLDENHPKQPPRCHYISLAKTMLNPNLEQSGIICLSLLDTYIGQGCELWGKMSTVFQVIVSIQGLVLVSEPYFNEAGYDKYKGSEKGTEKSRLYNEMVVLTLLESMTKVIGTSVVTHFRDEIIRHFNECGESMYKRLNEWADMTSIEYEKMPKFPLVPVTRGFSLKMKLLLPNFLKCLEEIKKL